MYSRSGKNLDRLVGTLAAFHPVSAGRPARTSMHPGSRYARPQPDFTLVTSIGDIDLLGEIPGGGTYEQLKPNAIELRVFHSAKPKPPECLSTIR